MNWLRKKTINFIVRNLFKGFTEEDILQMDSKGGIIYKTQILDKRSKEIIASQAGQIDDMLLWKILNDELRYRAEEKMFTKSESYDGMMFGKAVLYVIGIQKKRIKQLKKIK